MVGISGDNKNGGERSSDDQRKNDLPESAADTALPALGSKSTTSAEPFLPIDSTQIGDTDFDAICAFYGATFDQPNLEVAHRRYVARASDLIREFVGDDDHTKRCLWEHYANRQPIAVIQAAVGDRVEVQSLIEQFECWLVPRYFPQGFDSIANLAATLKPGKDQVDINNTCDHLREIAATFVDLFPLPHDEFLRLPPIIDPATIKIANEVTGVVRRVVQSDLEGPCTEAEQMRVLRQYYIDHLSSGDIQDAVNPTIDAQMIVVGFEVMFISYYFGIDDAKKWLMPIAAPPVGQEYPITRVCGFLRSIAKDFPDVFSLP